MPKAKSGAPKPGKDQPVYFENEKYRIDHMKAGVVYLRPSDRRINSHVVAAAQLEWDPVPAMWRTSAAKPLDVKPHRRPSKAKTSLGKARAKSQERTDPLKCPKCGVKRMRVAKGPKYEVHACLNPDCENYDPAYGPTDEFSIQPKGTEIEGHTRARSGQGTATAARRRREARAAAVDEAATHDMKERLKGTGIMSVKVDGLGEALQERFGEDAADRAGEAFASAKASPSRQTRFLTDVTRSEPIVTYEEYFHPRTKVSFRRRIPEGDDPLLSAKTERDERVLRLMKRLRGPKGPRQSEDLANGLLAILEGDAEMGEWAHETEDVPFVQWTNDVYRFGPVKKESWEKRRQAWRKKLAWQPKRGSKGRTVEEIGKAKHEETRGRIRITIQNGLKKADRKQLVDGEDFEVSYIMLHGAIKREIWPDDDQDPKDGMRAPVADWQRSAYPDFAQA